MGETLSREFFYLGGAMKLLLALVLAYVLSYSLVSGQTCVNLPPLSTIEKDFYLAVNASDQAGNIFILGEVWFAKWKFFQRDDNYR